MAEPGAYADLIVRVAEEQRALVRLSEGLQTRTDGLGNRPELSAGLGDGVHKGGGINTRGRGLKRVNIR